MKELLELLIVAGLSLSIVGTIILINIDVRNVGNTEDTQ